LEQGDTAILTVYRNDTLSAVSNTFAVPTDPKLGLLRLGINATLIIMGMDSYAYFAFPLWEDLGRFNQSLTPYPLQRQSHQMFTGAQTIRRSTLEANTTLTYSTLVDDEKVVVSYYTQTQELLWSQQYYFPVASRVGVTAAFSKEEQVVAEPWKLFYICYTFQFELSNALDLTQDGVVDINDIFAVIDHWGAYDLATEPCKAQDFDCNGEVSLFDVLDIVSGWGSTPVAQ
jgi:hypothetical protein